MKNNTTKHSKLKLVWLIILFATVSFSSFAQSSIISAASVTTGQLNTEQISRYNKAVASGAYSNYQLVHIQSLSAYQQNGKVAISFNDAPCSISYFSAGTVFYYGSDSDYYWYGNLLYDSSNECDLGSAMLISSGGSHFGQIQIQDKTFDIIDLTGGIQLIAAWDSNSDDLSSTCTPSFERTAKITGTTNGGTDFCKIRVLVLYTPAAQYADPDISNRILLAMSQTRQALSNSGIYPGYLDLELAGSHSIAYSETEYTSGGGLKEDIRNMTDSGTYNIADNIRYLRNLYQADIVMLIVKPTENDGLRGTVYKIQDSTYPYAVVQLTWATNSSYTFAHELGHILGARHEDESDSSWSIAHAHQVSFTTTRGWWPFQRTYTNTRKTLAHSNTGNDGSAILYYSTPDISYKGAALGTAISSHGARNAAQHIKNMACTISGYYPTEPEDYFTVAISGTGKICFGESATLYSHVTGPAGTYMYEWRSSADGVNYDSVLSNTHSLGFMMNSSSGTIFFRLKVTSPTGAIAYAYYTALQMPRQWCEAKMMPDSIQNGPTGQQLFSISPIPATDKINIHFKIPQPSAIQIGLFNASGQSVGNIYSGHIGEGQQQLIADVSAYANGVYFIKVTTSDYTCTQKIIINQ